jgi:hypothetical protein
LYTGYINKGEFIDTLAKIVISYFTLHRVHDRTYTGCEFVISYVFKTTALSWVTNAASEMMGNTDTYSQNTDRYLSPFTYYLKW